MLVQDTNKAKIQNGYDWGSEAHNDELVKALVATGLWTTHNRCHQKYTAVQSSMKGFSSGRYTIMIRPLKRKYKGNTHHVAIYWTPYSMDCKWIGYVKSEEELMEAIKSANPDLLDESRKY